MAAPALASRAARWASGLRIFDRLPPPFNVTVSSVPGPDFTLWCAGSRVVAAPPGRAGGRGRRAERHHHELPRPRATSACSGAAGWSPTWPTWPILLDDALAELTAAALDARGAVRVGVRRATRTWVPPTGRERYILWAATRGRGSVGRASPCQGEGRGFESRRPLQVGVRWDLPCPRSVCHAPASALRRSLVRHRDGGVAPDMLTTVGGLAPGDWATWAVAVTGLLAFGGVILGILIGVGQRHEDHLSSQYWVRLAL